MPDSDFEDEFKKGMQIPCPKCTEPMHMAATRCPNCQFDFSDDEVKANIASKKVNPTGCALIAGVIGIVALVGVMLSSGGKETADMSDTTASKSLSAGDEFTYKEAAKEVVAGRLRDPGSAVFSDMQVYPETEDQPTIICGYVNSRNGFGGMTGPQRFIAGGTVMIEEQFTPAQMTTAWMRFCN